ncbi:MAG: HNH endonuclease [Candidatus Binatia bacterium]
MSQLRKRPRLRLDSGAYQPLRRVVLERDGWRCQNCGLAANLHVHHIQPRSHLGDDLQQNLITLCASCHRDAHLEKIKT